MRPPTKRGQIPPTPASRLPPPPGVAGDIAKFVFNTLERQIPEVAILATLGILAGVCGKAFEVGGYGLNIRTVFIADDCVAEDALERGIGSIISAVSKSYPEITHFVDFTEYPNGSALSKSLASGPSFLNVVGDICSTLVGMTMSKNDRMVSLRETMQHPDKTTCSGYSLIVRTTPGSFFKSLAPLVLEREFIHSFMMVEAPRVRPPANENTDHPIPDFLREHVVNLCQISIGNRACHTTTSIKVDAEASQFLDMFDSHCNSEINGSDDEVLRLIWDGAHGKTLRVAALLAIADDCMLPIVKLQHAEWARGFVLSGIGFMSRHNKAAQKRNKK